MEKKQTREDFIQRLKRTAFYQEKIKSLYVCQETPMVVYFKAKAPYDTNDELQMMSDLADCEYDLREDFLACNSSDRDHTMYQLTRLE